MKIIFTILFSITCFNGFANMASPVQRGTSATAAFGSRNIDILKEVLAITLNADFKTAGFTVDYFINTDITGKQIPLLFYAENYKSDFKILVDGQEVQLLKIPYTYRAIDSTPFNKFSNAFTPSTTGEDERTTIAWGDTYNPSYKLSDLKYFEVSLTKGRHNIHVTYTATAWQDRSGWVKKYKYPYSLSPAKYWRSFGGLDVILNGILLQENITTNLGAPTSGRLDSIAVWNFSKLPGDVVLVNFEPQVNKTAATLISIQPTGIAIIISVLLSLVHFICIRYYRKGEQFAKYSPVVIAGSIIMPFLMLLSYTYAYSIIDSAVGPFASHYHGYTFLVFILYPLLMPVYWLAMWLVDNIYKKQPGSQLVE